MLESSHLLEQRVLLLMGELEHRGTSEFIYYFSFTSFTELLLSISGKNTTNTKLAPENVFA